MSFLAVPAGITVSYNGVTFNSTAQVRIRQKPNRDRADRITAHVTYEVSIAAHLHSSVADGSNLDTTMEDIRRRLSASAGRLTITGRGYGSNFDINAPGGTVKDVKYGPIPAILEWTPLGPANSALVRWTCTTTIPECTSARYENNPIAHTFDIEFRRDEHGYTTRTVNGEFEIPANRIAGATTLSDAADRYWESIYSGIPTLAGFRRQVMHRLDESKRFLRYVIVDQELPQDGFQHNCTDWDGRQTVQTSLLGGGGPGGYNAMGFRTGFSTISATYRVARDKMKKNAWNLFGELVLSRVTAGRRFVEPGLSLIPLEYSVDDHLSGDDVSCSLTYYVPARSFDKFLDACGMFEAVPNRDWGRYLASVGNTAAHPRGNAKLLYSKESEMLVSLCEATTTRVVTPGQLPQRPFENVLTGFFPPGQSWVKLKASLQYLGQSEMVAHKPMIRELRTGGMQMPGGISALTPGSNGSGGFGNISGQGSGAFWSENQFIDDIIQVPSAPTMRVALRVQCARLGYPPPDFGLIGLGGVPCYLERPSVITGAVATPVGPLFLGDYEHIYRLPAIPRGRLAWPLSF